jgi:hypothetical protein
MKFTQTAIEIFVVAHSFASRAEPVDAGFNLDYERNKQPLSQYKAAPKVYVGNICKT